MGLYQQRAQKHACKKNKKNRESFSTSFLDIGLA